MLKEREGINPTFTLPSPSWENREDRGTSEKIILRERKTREEGFLYLKGRASKRRKFLFSLPQRGREKGRIKKCYLPFKGRGGGWELQ